MLVASTREIIEKLEEYEKLYGIGAVTGIAFPFAGSSSVKYAIRIANDTHYNRVVNKDSNYKETTIEISSIEDDDLFKRR